MKKFKRGDRVLMNWKGEGYREVIITGGSGIMGYIVFNPDSGEFAIVSKDNLIAGGMENT